MKKLNRSVALIGAALLSTGALAGHLSAQTQVPVSSKGLYGCIVTGLATKSDGTLQLASCDQSQQGVYYSSDFGQNWTFASGGSFTEGRGYDVLMNDTYAVIRVANMPQPGQYGTRYYKALLPSVPGPWTPNWQEAFTGLAASSITSTELSGNYLYTVDQAGTVTVTNVATEATVGTATLPHALTAFNRLKVADGKLYVSSLKKGSGTPEGYLYRATLNGDGTPGAFSELTLPADVYPYNVMVAPNGNIFFGSGYYTSDLDITLGASYRSVDNGASFTQFSATSERGACFGGNSYLVGDKVSRDSGNNWTDMRTGTGTGGTVSFWNENCVVNPVNAESVIAQTVSGLARTAEFNSNNNPVWSDASKGIEGVNVTQIAQAPGVKDRMVVATSSGMFSTVDFTADTPAWSQLCFDPANCFGYGDVSSDASNDSVFYAAPAFPTKIYKGTVNTAATPPVSWAELTAASSYEVQQLGTYSFLPDVVLAARSGQISGTWGGGLYFYSKTDGAVTKIGLEGKVVRGFFAVNANLMFAAVGWFGGGISGG